MKARKSSPFRSPASITAAFSVALFSHFAAPAAHAATLFWDGGTVDILTPGNGAASNASGTWNTTLLNWDAGASPHVAWNNAANDIAEFNGGSNTITLGADVTVGRINQKGGGSGINIAEGTGLHSITLGSATTIFNVAGSATAGRSMSVTAEVTGASNLRIEGPTTTAGGAVNLNRVNTFTGSTLITQTTLRIGNAGAPAQLNNGNYTNTITIGTNAGFVYGSSLDQTLGGVISGAGTVTKNSSPSTLTLTATNTHTGSITVNAGTLALTGTGSVNSSSGITVDGSGAKFLQSGSVAVSSVVTLTNGTVTGSGVINTVNVGDATGGIVSNNNGVAGAPLTIGTLTFNGAAIVNTFGNASVPLVTTTLATNALGQVTINPTAASWTTGATYDLISHLGISPATFGQFVLGTVTGKSARQTATLIDGPLAVAVQIGGTSDFPYWVGDTNTEWDTTTSNNWKLFTAGTHTNFIPTDDVLFNDNASGTGPITVDINAANVATTITTFDNSTKNYLLNSSGGFGVSATSLIKNGTGNVTFGTANTTTGATTINNGTLSQTGGTATVGTLRIGGTNSAPGTTAALTLTGGTFSATTFDVLSGGDNMASNLTIGGTAAVTLPAFPTNAKGAGATATITFDSTTGFLSPAAASTTYLPAGTFNNAYLTANGAKFNMPTGTAITIGQVLENAVSPAAAGTLTKDGGATLTLSGANTYTGATNIIAGTLSLDNAAALSGTSGITVGGASAASLSSSLNGITLTAPITTADTGVTSSIAFGRSTNNTGSFTLNGAIGGAGNVLFTNPISAQSNNNLQTINLGAASNYLGTTTINPSDAGTTMTVRNSSGAPNALPATTVLIFGTRAGEGSSRVSTYDLVGQNQTLVGLSNAGLVPNDRNQRVTSATAATLTINNTSDFTFGGSTFESAGSTTTRAQITGVISLVKNGAGTFTLGGDLTGTPAPVAGGNTYTGTTTILGGILVLGESNSIQNSALDTAGSIAGNASNGLRTTVTALTLGGLAGNKNLADVFETTAGGYSTVTALTLNPGTGATPSYSAVIADGAVGMTLTKSGAGTQTLSGANSYTGATTVTAGTLALGASNVLPDTAVSIGNATLNAATFTDNLGTLDVTSTAKINLDAGATLAFANSNGTWTGSLNITGTFVSGSSLKFGINNTGLSASQLASISATGFTGFGLDANGFLTATAAADYTAWAALNGAGPNLNDDHDNDGVNNGTEYFIGGPTGITTGFTPLPGVINTLGVLSVTWTKAANYTGTYGTDFSVETSATLTGVWATEPSPGTVTISGNDVIYTFPPGTINFARLKVTGP